MKLRNNLYKNIASILVSDKADFKSAQNVILFTRAVSTYPSKSIYCLTINRLISFFERNIYSISVILEIMRDEGEDEEIIETIKLLHDNPTITTGGEVKHLCLVLLDYVKYAKILALKNSFISAIDVINDDAEDNIRESVDKLYTVSNQIVTAYSEVDSMKVSNSFDTNNIEQMRTVVAKTIDDRKPDKVILTGIRALNTMLSPGYLSGCLYVYAGCPGNYKSGILLSGHVDTCRYNKHILNVTKGKTPISMYISMENTMGQTINRLWSLLFPNSSMAAYSIEEAANMINTTLTENGFRSVILYYGYREKSTADIAQIIRQYNDEDNEVVALYFDYIKRVRPGRNDESVRSSEKAELNCIMNELKSICAQFNIPIITGHQLNRAAAAAIDNLINSGGFNKTDEAIGRANVGSALICGA